MWRDEIFAIAASSKPPAANSRRHRHGTGCAAVPHPSTQLPPRKTARSNVLTIEMSVPEARPPTAPESWLLSGISSPPWDRSRHNLTPNIPGGIRRGLHTGHRPGTAPLPVGSHRGPPRSSPHTITHRQIECLSQADSTDKERRERRERERRGERVRVCAHVWRGRVSVVGCSRTTWLKPRAPQELR